MGAENHRSSYYLGLDLGGTSIKGGVVDGSGHPISLVSGPTRAKLGPESGLDALAELARQAVAASGVDWSAIVAVGLGTAGTVNTAEGRIIRASNLPDWDGFPLGPRLQKRLDRPTVLLNDANAAAFGEHWAGAGRGAASLVLFTLGTGIGCGIIESGRILEGSHGLGGECGHITIQMVGGRRCSCGKRGHLEAYASATSLVRRAVEALESGAESTLRSHQAEGTLTAEAIARSATKRDRLALRLMRETARSLAVGATTVIHTLDPDLVLFGGGMIAAGPEFLRIIRVLVKAMLLDPAYSRTRIEFAALGSNAGFIGAAGWARKHSELVSTILDE